MNNRIEQGMVNDMTNNVLPPQLVMFVKNHTHLLPQELQTEIEKGQTDKDKCVIFLRIMAASECAKDNSTPKQARIAFGFPENLPVNETTHKVFYKNLLLKPEYASRTHKLNYIRACKNASRNTALGFTGMKIEGYRHSCNDASYKAETFCNVGIGTIVNNGNKFDTGPSGTHALTPWFKNGFTLNEQQLFECFGCSNTRVVFDVDGICRNFTVDSTSFDTRALQIGNDQIKDLLGTTKNPIFAKSLQYYKLLGDKFIVFFAKLFEYYEGPRVILATGDQGFMTFAMILNISCIQTQNETPSTPEAGGITSVTHFSSEPIDWGKLIILECHNIMLDYNDNIQFFRILSDKRSLTFDCASFGLENDIVDRVFKAVLGKIQQMLAEVESFMLPDNLTEYSLNPDLALREYNRLLTFTPYLVNKKNTGLISSTWKTICDGDGGGIRQHLLREGNLSPVSQGIIRSINVSDSSTLYQILGIVCSKSKIRKDPYEKLYSPRRDHGDDGGNKKRKHDFTSDKNVVSISKSLWDNLKEKRENQKQAKQGEQGEQLSDELFEMSIHTVETIQRKCIDKFISFFQRETILSNDSYLEEYIEEFYLDEFVENVIVKMSSVFHNDYDIENVVSAVTSAWEEISVTIISIDVKLMLALASSASSVATTTSVQDVKHASAIPTSGSGQGSQSLQSPWDSQLSQGHEDPLRSPTESDSSNWLHTPPHLHQGFAITQPLQVPQVVDRVSVMSYVRPEVIGPELHLFESTQRFNNENNNLDVLKEDGSVIKIGNGGSKRNKRRNARRKITRRQSHLKKYRNRNPTKKRVKHNKKRQTRKRK